MRVIIVMCLLGVLAAAQTNTSANPADAPADNSAVKADAGAPANPADTLVIPAGTKVPMVLKHAISTKQTREGDGVYAETTFPVVANGRVLIPAGTYVQGRISHIQRAGHVKGRAEVLMHFSTLVYPSGYTVLLPGSLENAPGVDKSSVKDQEGTIQQDSQTGEKAGKAAERGLGGATGGAVIGGLSSGSATGAGIGAGVGGAIGVLSALLSRGSDLKLDAGTTIEMVIQRDVPVDSSRVPTTTGTSSTITTMK